MEDGQAKFKFSIGDFFEMEDLKKEFFDYCQASKIDPRKIKNCNEGLYIITEYYKKSQSVSKFPDSLSYTSGLTLWDEDPSSGETEVLTLNFNRKICLNENGSHFWMFSYTLDYSIVGLGPIEKYQADWCEDRTKTESFIKEVENEPNFVQAKNLTILKVRMLFYPVKVDF